MSKTPWLAMLLLSLSACSNEGDWEDRDIAVDSDTGDRLDEVAAQYVINVLGGPWQNAVYRVAIAVPEPTPGPTLALINRASLCDTW